ncbi:MAG TPA: MFS transporter [Candidatus Polarisedimenticolia bacterium]|nr:MFS transporter [Candidatus Polarisedimenticolia bacterium]
MTERPSTDRTLLYAGAFLRALAVGMVSVLVGLHLQGIGFAAGTIGMVVSAGLAGNALAALLVTWRGDQVGRRAALLLLAALASGGGLVVAFGSNAAVIGVAAFLGMLNGMGRDRGASLIIDQVILPGTAGHDARTRIFAVYNVVQDIGHALGGLLAGLPVLLQRAAGIEEVTSFRASVAAYAALLALSALLYLRLSPRVEATHRGSHPPLSPASRRTLWRIASLFAIDSLAGGFLTSALLSLYFHERFGAGPATLGGLFFGARLMNAASHLGAAWLAKRIGLVNTMVFTHIPSSLLLVTVAWAPSFAVASVLFLLREGLVEMDVPTRQSYVMAIFRPEERTFASGVTHLVRMGAWSVAPSFAGLMMQGMSMTTPLVIGAAMKVGYDLALWYAFRHQRPPEESQGAAESVAAADLSRVSSEI